jgi:hypothetical protein
MFGLNMVVSKGKTVFIGDTSVNEYPSSEELADIAISSDEGYSFTDVSPINTVLPLLTTIFNPNIISPFLGGITFLIFSSDWEYLLVFVFIFVFVFVFLFVIVFVFVVVFVFVFVFIFVFLFEDH